MSSLFLLLQSEKLHLKNTCNIRALGSLCDVTPVENLSSRVTGTSVAAYFVYNILAGNFSNVLVPRVIEYKRLMSRPVTHVTLNM